MLGLRFRQVVQSVASTSSRPAVQQIHLSSVLSAARKQSSSVIRKQNIRKQAKRAEATLADRPSVVLGTRPSDEAVKWPNCMLAKILVDEEALIRGEAIEPVQLPVGTVEMPKQLAFGVGEAEKELLFEQLPEMSAQAALWPTSHAVGTARGVVDSHKLETAQQAELKKAHNLAKVVDLRNTNAAGLAFENRRRIILAFSTPENTFDTGRPEVQAALKTYEIRKLYKHLITFKRDVGNRLGLRKLVHQRAKILRYLRDMNRDRYETILEKLALEPEAVEGELVV